MTLSAASASIIARMQAMPLTFEVITLFVDGTSRSHKVATRGQADNYIVGEKRKIGRVLQDRMTGAKSEVVDVYVAAL